MDPTLADQINVEAVGPDEFESTSLPVRMGNSLPIAYGGCALSVAVNAAVKTVTAPHYLYSALGHFLGPARTDMKLKCRVRRLRDTRTFSTRYVEVSQTQKDGQSRLCLTLVADFQAGEDSLYNYTDLPQRQWLPPDQCPSADDLHDSLIEQKILREENSQAYEAAYHVMNSLFDARFCPEGVSGQNLNGYAKQVITTQDHLPITSKISGDWFKTKTALPKADQPAALAFMMDSGLSFLPLVHDHKYLEDVGACSTLDFALRIFVRDFDINTWHIREKITHRGSEGRTFTEGRIWDEQQRMVASMSQQCIMRPAPGSGSRL